MTGESIVVAGGTMRPTDDLINQIFSSSKHRVKEFIYDHVVPKTSILPIILSKGPTDEGAGNDPF
uniref:Uncharacterized protein n=1 Tax=Megaselia scalaris TaxID=36166 RepID=T1GL11_MEGSC